jgi:drug/metabolite transporter (DMT)-like permease
MNTTDPADGWGPLVAVRIGVLGVAAVFLLATWSVIRREVQSSVPVRWWLFAALAGAMDALGNVTLILALASLDLTTVAIVAATTPAIAAVIGWVALRERLRMTQQAGIALAVGAVILHQISR